jgi:hypothetical protein
MPLTTPCDQAMRWEFVGSLGLWNAFATAASNPHNVCCLCHVRLTYVFEHQLLPIPQHVSDADHASERPCHFLNLEIGLS